MGRRPEIRSRRDPAAQRGLAGTYPLEWRFESGTGTNAEVLIAAARAQSRHPGQRAQTTAKVHLEKSRDGFAILRIDSSTEANAPGIDDAEVRRIAEHSKQKCPVSKLPASATVPWTPGWRRE